MCIDAEKQRVEQRRRREEEKRRWLDDPPPSLQPPAPAAGLHQLPASGPVQHPSTTQPDSFMDSSRMEQPS